MTFPSASQITATGATCAMLLQHFGWVAPLQERSADNRDANFEARDMLKQCMEEREEYLDMLLFEGEP